MMLALVTVATEHPQVTLTLTAKPPVAAVVNVEAPAVPTTLAAMARPGARMSCTRTPLR
jgi:hypothetical protein